MKNPHSFYKEQLEKYNLELQVFRRRLFASSMIRLFVFIGLIIGMYFFYGIPKAIFLIVILGIVAFIFLVSRHSNLQYKRDLILAIISINEVELEVLNRNFDRLSWGDNYRESNHFYSHDIDLFGEGSLFQYINRTSLESGGDALANFLKANNIESIPEKQNAIKELADFVQWRQRFSAIASLVKTDVSADDVVSWLKNYKFFSPKAIQYVSIVFSLISCLCIFLYFIDMIPGIVLLGWFLLGLTITGRYFKKTNKLSQQTSRIKNTLDQYHKLLFEIEKQEFITGLLSDKRSLIISSVKSASAVLRKFARHLDALDQRNNMLIGVLANGFLLRDLSQVRLIEKWIDNHKKDVQIWFDVIAFFDAYNSFGNYGFNHPEQEYPIIQNDKTILELCDAGHPLIDPAISILNNFSIDQEQFFIITGANMAGKSTFLRTVALQIVMANVGLAVCATHSKYTPIKLITSMRTTDSLSDDESYFFSELKRLKFIVDEIKTDRYFIILDEILKGTNSTDKAIGSRKFIDKLLKSRSTGIIATHDLSLCDVAVDAPQVQNFFFDAQIKNDELFFDYTFKPGICKNMNASFLLKKMEIVD